MEALKREIQNGRQYDHLFPVADLRDETVKKGATVSDTVKFIPKVVKDTIEQTKEISEILRGNSLSETCKNIWDFVYHHINYHKDEDGTEQIRTPARSWHDRQRGVDCDCYTVFISSILTNQQIPHSLRIAKYRKDYFQHIYPVVHKPNGKYITIDCVVDHFNYEEPYTEIKDTTMDLQYLSGLDETGEIGKLFKKKSDPKPAPKKNPQPLIKKGVVKQVVKKAVHVVNRVNPATVLLRNGVLASMKLNLMNVAHQLKYAYLSDADAEKRGIDMAKFQKLKAIKSKLESIFFGAGGKPENLKAAILTGKGNPNHEVKGLGDLNQNSSISELLGDEIFLDENEETLGELGEPVTAAAITAASGAIAVIAGLLKGIGNIFKKKDAAGSSDSVSPEDSNADIYESQSDSGGNEIIKTDAGEDNADNSSADNSGDGSTNKSAQKSPSGNSADGDDSAKQGFWDKNKKWLKPTLIGASGVGLLYLGYRAVTAKEEEPPKQLSGTKNKTHPHQKKSPVALM